MQNNTSTAAEVHPGEEIIIHSPSAGEFADTYLTVDAITHDADGVVLEVTDRLRAQHTVCVPSKTLAYRYASK